MPVVVPVLLIIAKNDQRLYFDVPNRARPSVNADSLVGTLMKTIRYAWMVRPEISLGTIVEISCRTRDEHEYTINHWHV